MYNMTLEQKDTEALFERVSNANSQMSAASREKSHVEEKFLDYFYEIREYITALPRLAENTYVRRIQVSLDSDIIGIDSARLSVKSTYTFNRPGRSEITKLDFYISIPSKLLPSFDDFLNTPYNKASRELKDFFKKEAETFFFRTYLIPLASMV